MKRWSMIALICLVVLVYWSIAAFIETLACHIRSALGSLWVIHRILPLLCIVIVGVIVLLVWLCIVQFVRRKTLLACVVLLSSLCAYSFAVGFLYPPWGLLNLSGRRKIRDETAMRPGGSCTVFWRVAQGMTTNEVIDKVGHPLCVTSSGYDHDFLANRTNELLWIYAVPTGTFYSEGFVRALSVDVTMRVARVYDMYYYY